MFQDKHFSASNIFKQENQNKKTITRNNYF